ncbi:MAG TPA: hypothetical protein VG735_00970 [Caulobacterales bacterium]|nr:hypothetical protein [Caulobacterales bacterium]
MSRAIFIGASLALALASFSGIANAQQCRNASGKFIACPTSAAPPTRCKDASGKFAKCSAPGAVPITASVKPPIKPSVKAASVKPPVKPSVTPVALSVKPKPATSTKPK